jgi:biofilm PGA synthesis lipoprotein PgaB
MFACRKLRRFCCLLALSLGVVPVQSSVVLQYHHVSEDTPAATSVSPALFRKHMAHIREAGYAVVALEDLVAQLKAGKALSDKTVAITFDDGYTSIYDLAFPILKSHGWPFTVFVNTKPHDQQHGHFASWEQLREMGAAGATIANHSYSHPHMLRRQPGETDEVWRERMREEILRAEQTIAEETGQEHRLFAYPFGEYDSATQGLLAELGFVAFGQQSGPLGASDHLQALPRFPFGGPYGTIEDFRTKLASLSMPLSKVEVYVDGKRSAEPLLPADSTRPRLVMHLEDEKVARRVQCFASGQGAIPVKVEGATVAAQAEKALPVGRSRYNCTAPSGQAGRFYWYSQPFIRKQADGGWYPET